MLKVEGRDHEVFSIYRDPSSKDPFKEGFRLFFLLDNLNLSYGAYFTAYPTEYIKDLVESSKDKEHLGKGPIRDSGFYFYGVGDKDTLYAGRYMPVSHEVNGGKETTVYKKNPNY